jgi:two-component system OmpR family response regulator
MRLLLIEDEHDLARILKNSLEKAGFAVDVAYDGIEGEYLGNEGIYELAILDLGLPQRSGIEVLKNWRAKKNTLPVLVLTARDAWYEKVDGFKADQMIIWANPFTQKNYFHALTLCSTVSINILAENYRWVA